jgi:DNA polymerase-4
MPLRTLAVDFNSYFASVEQQENPALRGRPIAIVPVLAATTCCISISQAAKARGVRAEMGAAEARARCPELHFVEARPEVYVRYHRRLLEAIESCLHISAIKSIDEVECDLTATFAPREEAVAVARRIKAAVAGTVGSCLTCSIGIAPNWTLAKLASDLQKPDGLVVIEESDLPHRLLGLELQDFLGIGPRMEARLRAHGIGTVARLYAATKAELRGVWGGVEGERMHARLRGEPIPHEAGQHQTISHSHVLPPQLRTEALSLAVLHRLLQKAALRLRSIAHYAAGLEVFVGYRDGGRWQEEIRFTETQDTRQLTHALRQLWDRRPGFSDRRVPMQVGLVLHGLIPAAGHTPDLFAQSREQAHDRLHQAMDRLNQTFGNGSVYYGGAFGATRDAPMRISFTRVPTPELEEIDPGRGRRIRGAPVAVPEGGGRMVEG